MHAPLLPPERAGGLYRPFPYRNLSPNSKKACWRIVFLPLLLNAVGFLEDWHSVVGFVVNVLQGAWPFLSSAAFLGEAG